MQQYIMKFEEYLTHVFSTSDVPEKLLAAMNYSLFSSGKRIRPLLCIATALLDEQHAVETIFPLAAAIEMVHTYSLIHDDLPAMDDDDIRRGKPSNHKQFDEGTAILAGDGLLSHSFYVLQDTVVDASKLIALNKLFAQTIGVAGMVAGQIDDMILEHSDTITIEMLERVQQRKTGKLFTCAIVGSAIVYNYPQAIVNELDQLASSLGSLFQMVDDYLDDDPTTGKTIGIDAINNKPTFLSLLGKEALKEHMTAYIQLIEDILARLNADGYNTSAFTTILQMIVKKI